MSGLDGLPDEATAAKEQDACAEDAMSLEERQRRWGFTLSELQAATKVVRTLFHNPALYLGDPYLADSRLYTMITRDRKTKRENRDVFNAIMNEEKTRRKRYQRLQHIETIRKTAMKREREAALNALVLPDATRRAIEQGTAVDQTSDEPMCCNDDDGPRVDAESVPGHTLAPAQVETLRVIGAFENLLRLEQAYAGTFRDPAETSPSSAASPDVDWVAITQLTAQVYRYVPHRFGSQMPPPLLPGPLPPHLPEREWMYYVAGAKLLLARRARELYRGTPQTTLEDVLVCTPMQAELGDVARLRHAADGSWCCRTGDDAPPVTRTIADALPLLETALVAPETLREDERAALEPASGADGTTFGIRDVAGQSLNVYIARRLYATAAVREWGESPVEIQRAPPTSDAEEPDTYCVFDEVQRYACEPSDAGGTPGSVDAQRAWTALKLNKWASCHTCKVRYNRLHPYYYSMCHLCGEYNYNKRLLSRDLRGKVVLLTGCRIKIGYAMAISLLRCGAELLGITRFIHEAAARFRQEPDYDVWRHRLHLFSIDLRDLWIVTQFCAFVRHRFPKLFAIVNNATQTIARTPQYTAHLRAIETHPAPELSAAIAGDPVSHEWHNFFLHHTSVAVGQPLTIESHPHAQPFCGDDDTVASSSSRVVAESTAEVRDVVPRTATESGGERTLIFDRYDTQAEESDLREKNSWVLKLAEVQGSEAAEVMAINALAPFILNSKLKECLLNRRGDATPNEPRFIVNVSAMEGRFYQYKQTTHPHTNMAKAALNMMTRTSGEDYAQDGIYMNSVDTGWITDESPMLKKYRRAEQYLLCPLDEVDAAARCLDLIYTNSTAYGKFFKDYREITW